MAQRVGLSRLARIAGALMALAMPLYAQRSDTLRRVTLNAGAIELGMAGSLTMIEGMAHATLGLRGGVFLGAPAGLIALESALSYSHINALDRVDAGALIAWQHAIEESAAYPYVGLGGGVRQEWIGSFRQERFPVGFTIGIRALVAQEAALHAAYDFRRILSDPTGVYTEHQIVLGVALLFGNAPPHAGTPR